MPALLRLGHLTSGQGRDSQAAQQHAARGLMVWKAAIDRELMPDDAALTQLQSEGTHWMSEHTLEELQWPEQPLRGIMCTELAQLGVAHFARKYPKVQDSLLGTILQVVTKYNSVLIAHAAKQAEAPPPDAPPPPPTAEGSVERRLSAKLLEAVLLQWRDPIDTLRSASKAFGGLEALLGGDGFELKTGLWKRKGWASMDELRRKLEVLKELRDLVRSLGRSSGWGPLRRAPQQRLDMRGRPGLLRTPLEAQETRGLTRSDDIGRLLPSELALLARAKTVRSAKLLFFSKVVEKSLATYQRDGWGEFPTAVIMDRMEVRPTADMGPILLCVDTSGSMRGPRETVAKSLALECMRAAKEQSRECYVFAFAGLNEVQELELNYDMASVNNLLGFLEATFNGGSDFNEPVKRCLERLNDAKWQNSDILLVSDGELRQPKPEIMAKLGGSKVKLGLRVHGLIVGQPEEARADPAVLRSLCTNPLPQGGTETLVTRFENWQGVKEDSSMQFDWDDVEGNSRRRLAGLQLEKLRDAEIKRKRKEINSKKYGKNKVNKMNRMPGKNETFSP